jgi:hypothetical protein
MLFMVWLEVCSAAKKIASESIKNSKLWVVNPSMPETFQNSSRASTVKLRA